MLVSVIVPVYNVKKYIERCVDSILCQTYKDIEVILVDDGSTDNSGQVCDEYAKKDSRIIVIHKRNGGLSSARNVGLKIAKGEYINFVDSDDYIAETFIEELISLCLKYDAGMACVKYVEVRESKTEIPNDSKNIVCMEWNDFIAAIVRRDSTKNITYCVWSKVFRRDIIKELSFPEGRAYEDILYTTIAAYNSHKCVYKDISLYNYRIREGSISKSTYEEGIDIRLITDRIPTQLEQLVFIESKCNRDFSAMISFEYYAELWGLLKKCSSVEWKKKIRNAMKLFKISWVRIARLPYPLKVKIRGVAKMYIPILNHYR